jgi:hypothetical protein
MTPEKTLAKIEAQARRAVLHPVLTASLAELAAGSEDVPPATFLSFLAELAHATLNYRKGSREQRRELRRIAMQPAATDAEFLHHVITSYLTPAGPTCPGLH